MTGKSFETLRRYCSKEDSEGSAPVNVELYLDHVETALSRPALATEGRIHNQLPVSRHTFRQRGSREPSLQESRQKLAPNSLDQPTSLLFHTRIAFLKT